MVVKKIVPLLLLLLAVKGFSQSAQRQVDDKFAKSGYMALGLRNTFSTFNGGGNYTGYGVGGHFRLMFGKRINSEWYADYISNNIGNMGHRTDYHIGWSVMYYVINPFVEHNSSQYIRLFTPYVETGHCFDYGAVYVNGASSPAAKRWSSALQAGVGTHINFTPRFDLTVKCQYMMHLGNEIHADVRNGALEVENHDHIDLEGHLLFSVSANYKFIRIWTKRK